MPASNVLTLPGWQNSGPDHWQSRWEARYGYQRVDQHDWKTPRRGDWIARLEDVVLGTEGPVVLVAHSLGCILIAAWAQVSRSTARVQGALLVAPGDAERDELRDVLPSWSPIVRQPLPFPSVLVGSRNDPYCRYERAQGLAESWGSRFVDLGNAGHINAESGLGDWPAGVKMLLSVASTSAFGESI
ncbi:MAG: alpha/beta hydrolase [Hydrogenophaga sp.]|nr:alpha/beta hydrolase [Hydrogenophaga sp.]